jgi:hypothetical protein
MACIKMLMDLGVQDIIAFNKDGAVYKGAKGLTETEDVAGRSAPTSMASRAPTKMRSKSATCSSASPSAACSAAKT